MAYQDIIAQFQAQQEAARLANEQRYAQALEIYDEIISTYQPEGGFLTGAKAELERERTRTVAGQTQQLVSSGLFGTSITAGLGQKWEEEVGMPARLKLEDVRMGRLAEALQSKAGVIERREDIGPDYATIAALSAQAGARPTTIYQQYGGAGDGWELPGFEEWGGATSPFGGRTGEPSAPARRAGVGAGTGLGTPATQMTPQEYWAGAQEFPRTGGMQEQFPGEMGMLDYTTAAQLGVAQPGGATAQTSAWHQTIRQQYERDKAAGRPGAGSFAQWQQNYGASYGA